MATLNAPTLQLPPSGTKYTHQDSDTIILWGQVTGFTEDEATYTTYLTPIGIATGWIWNSGQFNIDSGMRSSIGSGTEWLWAVISSSANSRPDNLGVSE